MRERSSGLLCNPICNIFDEDRFPYGAVAFLLMATHFSLKFKRLQLKHVKQRYQHDMIARKNMFHSTIMPKSQISSSPFHCCKLVCYLVMIDFGVSQSVSPENVPRRLMIIRFYVGNN